MKQLLVAIIFIATTIHLAVASPWRVSLLTVDPGDEIYELEGHTALRLQSDTTDIVINWGVFNFDDPGFVWRFALGETDYYAAAYYTDMFINAYNFEGRNVVEQQLALDSIQAEKLVADIFNTLNHPGLRTYRYNYVLDNCATRPIAYVERALGTKIDIPTLLTDRTFRSEMRRYHGRYSWYQFGIDLALGSLIDQPLTVRQMGFAPVTMKILMDVATIDTPDGPIHAVVNTQQLNGPFPPVESPVGFPLSPLAVALIVFAVVLVSVARSRSRRSRWMRWLCCLFFSLETLGGLLVAFLVFVSTHYATSPNWVILWLNPFAAIGAVGVWMRRAMMVVRWWAVLNIAALAALTVIFIIGIQSANPAFWPLMGASALLSVNLIIAKK